MTAAGRRSELFRALGALAERPLAGHARIAAALGLPEAPDAADHTAVLLLELPPYASVYLGPEGMLGGEARDRVAGFWAALALVPPAEPDHLAALLGLYAGLLDAELAKTADARRLLRREARRALLWEHLLSWLWPYTVAVEHAAGGTYRGWARLLRDTLAAEAELLGPPPVLPAQLRAVPPIPSPGREGVEAAVTAIFAPARSGLIVTRSDLARLGRSAGVATRMGERAFILRTMLEQDARATLEGLAATAGRWAAVHAGAEPTLGGVARHWRNRAEEARATLLTLGRRARRAQGQASDRPGGPELLGSPQAPGRARRASTPR